MKLKKLFENEDINNKNEINLNENEEKNENNKIVLKNKTLKAKLDRFKRHTNEIIKKVKDILKTINDNKNINLEEFKIKNNQEIKYNNGKYVGCTYNGLREGKGIYYYNDGNKYEGDYKNGKKEGKGIYYFNVDPWKGDKYEGDWKNGKKEGKGIFYYSNGDREMGDYANGKEIGKHAILTSSGEMKEKFY